MSMGIEPMSVPFDGAPRDAAVVLRDARERGIAVWVEGDRLCYRAPDGALEAGLRSRLLAAKTDLQDVLRREEADRDLPLSEGQRALWLQHRMAPESPAYHVAFAGFAEGPLAARDLTLALSMVCDRHAILRSTFELGDEGPRRRVHPRLVASVREVDCGAAEGDTLDRAVHEEYSRPFDLSREPPLRLGILRRDAGPSVLLLTVHHIAADGWSLWLILEELRSAYRAVATGGASGLPPPGASYRDFVNREAERLGDGSATELVDYWRAALADAPPRMRLSGTSTQRPRRRFTGASIALNWDRSLVDAARAVARREGVSLYVVLLAAYAVALGRHTGSSDLLIGCPTEGRDDAGFEKTVGHFVNVLPLRATLRDGDTFASLLARLRHTVLEGMRHRGLPLSRIESQALEPRDGLPPIQALCVLVQPQTGGDLVATLSGEGASVDFGGFAFRPFAIAQQEGQFELVLEVLDSRDGVQVRLKYDADVLDGEAAARLGDLVTLALSAVVEDTASAISGRELLRPADDAALRRWNDTGRTYEAASLVERIEAHAATTPGRVAVQFDGRALTYGELNERANQLARWMRGRGIEQGARVGVAVDRSFELMTALVATWKAGAAFVPFVSELPPVRLVAMLEAARPALVLATTATRGPFDGKAEVLCLDEPPSDLESQSRDDLRLAHDPRALAHVIYTSGSTGEPKGVMSHHQGLQNRIDWGQETFALRATDVVLHKTPLSFDVALWELFWPLCTGAKLVLARPGGHRDPEYLARLCRHEAVTVCHFVPSMLRAFLDEPAIVGCSTLRLTFASGEALKPDLVARFFERLPGELHNLYGPTEASIEVTHHACARGDDSIPIGRPIANVQVHVLSPSLVRVPVGSVGELYIGGVAVADGYLGRPDLTRARFLPDPFSGNGERRLYKTGDLARHRADGSLEYLGRTDRQVKLRGVRIELEEIERALLSNPRVTNAAVDVDGLPGKEPDRIVAWYTGAASAAELSVELARALPAAMVPAAIVGVGEIPVGTNGKADHRRLPRPSRGAVTGVPLESIGGTARVVAAALCEILSIERIDPEASFFSLGADSLSMVRLHQRLRRELGRELELAALFDHPSCLALAGWIDAAADTEPRRPDPREGRERLARRRALRLRSEEA